jgi:hypothetical protein
MFSIPILLIVAALYLSAKQPSRRYLLKALFVVVLLGFIDFILHIYYLLENNCGSKYDPDIGCLNVLPGWLTELGMLLLLVAILISIASIILAVRDRSNRK